MVVWVSQALGRIELIELSVFHLRFLGVSGIHLLERLCHHGSRGGLRGGTIKPGDLSNIIYLIRHK